MVPFCHLLSAINQPAQLLLHAFYFCHLRFKLALLPLLLLPLPLLCLSNTLSLQLHASSPQPTSPPPAAQWPVLPQAPALRRTRRAAQLGRPALPGVAQQRSRLLPVAGRCGEGMVCQVYSSCLLGILWGEVFGFYTYVQLTLDAQSLSEIAMRLGFNGFLDVWW